MTDPTNSRTDRPAPPDIVREFNQLDRRAEEMRADPDRWTTADHDDLYARLLQLQAKVLALAEGVS